MPLVPIKRNSKAKDRTPRSQAEHSKLGDLQHNIEAKNMLIYLFCITHTIYHAFCNTLLLLNTLQAAGGWLVGLLRVGAAAHGLAPGTRRQCS